MNMLINSLGRSAAAAALLTFYMVSSPARAQVEHRSAATKPSNEVVIRGYARWNKKCEALDPPQITLDVSPQNGFVCVRPNKGTVRLVREGKAVHCVGQKVAGTELVYLPRSKFVGLDRIRYTVTFKDVTHTVDADIVVRSDNALIESGSTAATIAEPQSQGPVGRCAPLVS